MEEAEAYRALLERYGYTKEELAGRVGGGKRHRKKTPKKDTAESAT